VFAFLVLVVAGVVRIKLMQAHWRTLPGLVPTTIAARDLDSSRTITADDVTTVYLPPRAGRTADIERIVGRRVPRTINAGRQIDVTELHAPQLMARSAIAAGQKVSNAAVRVGWAVEQDASLRSPAAAVGLCLVTTVDVGTVIRRDDLSTCP
jgi:flagella basal body P-ring formation protein FlgA